MLPETKITENIILKIYEAMLQRKSNGVLWMWFWMYKNMYVYIATNIKKWKQVEVASTYKSEMYGQQTKKDAIITEPQDDNIIEDSLLEDNCTETSGINCWAYWRSYPEDMERPSSNTWICKLLWSTDGGIKYL